ncbi:MAG: glycosyl transferase family 2, partial [Candidatus Amesbacteria bacterium GW2011_GWA2_47_11]
NNIALKTITSEFVLLLNPDTIVYPQTIQTVLQYIKSHSDVGAATCRVELPDGTLDYSCHRHFPDPWNSFLHLYSWFFKKFSKYSNSDITDTIHEIDALSGAFAMIRTQAGRHVNWLDEDYFFNGEDIDFCYKLKLSGWKVMYIPGVKITHFKGSSAKATRSTRLAWSRNSTHAMRLFYQKHLAAKYPALLNYLVYAGIYLLQTVRKLKARYN